MVRRAGACVALLGFAASVLAGAWVGNSPPVVLERALWTMLGCFLIGMLGGWVAERVIRERLSQYEKELLDSLESEEKVQGKAGPPGEEPVVGTPVGRDGAEAGSAVPLGR